MVNLEAYKIHSLFIINLSYNYFSEYSYTFNQFFLVTFRIFPASFLEFRSFVFCIILRTDKQTLHKPKKWKHIPSGEVLAEVNNSPENSRYV